MFRLRSYLLDEKYKNIYFEWVLLLRNIQPISKSYFRIRTIINTLISTILKIIMKKKLLSIELQFFKLCY